MSNQDRITLRTLQSKKRDRRPITMLTAYDATMARILDEAGIDSILVGDSAAQVVLGHDSTLPAAMDFMVALAAGVRRGARRAWLVGDMPFLSYTVSEEEAVRNAGRFMAESGCDCVKVECDGRLSATVERMAAAGIPVMCHLGLRPQSVHQYGGYRAQGRTADTARRLIEDAKKLEEAGACALLLEAVPPEPARLITEATELIVIGCGAGPHVDGQVVVTHDMLSLTAGPPPRFVKQFGDLGRALETAVKQYIKETDDRAWPASEHCYRMEEGEAGRLKP